MGLEGLPQAAPGLLTKFSWSLANAVTVLCRQQPSGLTPAFSRSLAAASLGEEAGAGPHDFCQALCSHYIGAWEPWQRGEDGGRGWCCPCMPLHGKQEPEGREGAAASEPSLPAVGSSMVSLPEAHGMWESIPQLPCTWQLDAQGHPLRWGRHSHPAELKLCHFLSLGGGGSETSYQGNKRK